MASEINFDLKGSMFMLLSLLGIFGVWKLLLPIFVALVGSAYQVVLSGDIDVPVAFNNTTSQMSTDTASDFQTLNNADAIILSLIALAVILRLFWPIIGPYITGMGKGNKSGGMV